MKKLTNVVALEMVLAMEEVKNNVELFEKLETMKNQFEKKNKSSVGADGKRTLTAEQKKNEVLKELIVEILGRFEEPKQIKELMVIEELKEYSNQKLSALFKQLVAEEKVVRTEVKKVAMFGLAK